MFPTFTKILGQLLHLCLLATIQQEMVATDIWEAM